MLADIGCFDVLLITKEWNNDSWESVSKTDGGSSGSSVMADCLDPPFGKEPVVRDVA
jgi:hypothetical protein